MRMMSPEEIAGVHAHVRTLLLPMMGEEYAAEETNRPERDITCGPPPAKKDFYEWENQAVDFGPQEDEVTMYISQRHVMDDDRDLLGWWKLNSVVYPKLSKVARSVLCIPASSSSSERVFSAAGRTIEQRRTALKPATVDAILFLHDNM